MIMSTHTLNLTPKVYEYYQAHATREPKILSELREYTAKEFSSKAIMQISPEQGQFMALLVKIMNAKKILEIGTFTGYSALWMALSLPADGKIVTCDIDADITGVAKKFWQQAGVLEKIESKLGEASVTLQQLISTNENGFAEKNIFDFAFIDADKVGYDRYYEQCLLLVRSGGVIAIDNTLQDGLVADPENESPNVKAIRHLNDKILNDRRVLMNMLPVSDGLTLVYKL